MEVRCTGCSKLFRVSDDKITGAGIKFSCTRCSNTVKITREDFEAYLAAKAVPAAAPREQSPPPESPAPQQDAPAASPDIFDLSEPFAVPETSGSETSAKASQEDPFASPASMPAAPVSAPPVSTSPVSAAPVSQSEAPLADRKEPGKAQPEAATAPRPKPAPARPAAQPLSPAPVPVAAPSQVQEPRPTVAAPVTDFAPPAASSGRGKKIAIIAAVLLLLGGAAAGVWYYLGGLAGQASREVRTITTPDGLQVLNASGIIDPATQDLIVSGLIENKTDKPRPAWYIVIDVYDAQNAVLTRGRMLSGKQFYTRRDFDILVKRGIDIRDLKMKSLEQGVTIPAGGSVNFEVRMIDPPVGVASFNVTLQPFDPMQLFKEMTEEQK